MKKKKRIKKVLKKALKKATKKAAPKKKLAKLATKKLAPKQLAKPKKKVLGRNSRKKAAILLRTSEANRKAGHAAIAKMYGEKRVDNGEKATLQWYLEKQLEDLIRRGKRAKGKAVTAFVTKVDKKRKTVTLSKRKPKKAAKKAKKAIAILGAKPVQTDLEEAIEAAPPTPVIDRELTAVSNSFDEETAQEMA